MSVKEKLVNMGFTPSEVKALLAGEVVKKGFYYYWLTPFNQLCYAAIHPVKAKKYNILNAIGTVRL